MSTNRHSSLSRLLCVYLFVYILPYLILMSESCSVTSNNKLSCVSLRITTWNVAGKEPNGPIDRLFDDSSRILENTTDTGTLQILKNPHIQVVGLQESPVFGLTNVKLLFSEPWIANITSVLKPKGYILYKHHKLQGIILCIYVKKDLLLYARDFETESVKTGFGGLLGNKGGVSLRFTINGNSFSITNSHLAAHKENLKQRIDDYNSIVEDTKFLVDKNTPGILSHDYSFWFGDLNFRLDNIEKSDVLGNLTEIRTDMSKRSQIIDRLLEKDQLNTVRAKGQAFSEFTEAKPSFLPTYKFHIGLKDAYDAENRIPAWTDRILYKFTKNAYMESMKDVKLNIQQHFYDSHPFTDLSDHKPVSSLFSLVTFNPKDFNPSRIPYGAIQFESIGSWKVNEDAHVWYSVSDEIFNMRPKALSSWDRVALYKADFGSLDDYQTIVFVNNLAKLAPHDDAQSIAYQASPSSSRSSSPSSSRRSSTVSVGGEALDLANQTNSRKYFSVVVPDEAILVPGKYVLLYLQVTPAHESNVLGVSNEFQVTQK